MKYALFAFPAMLLFAATAAPASTVYTGTGGNIPDFSQGVPGLRISTINVTDSYPVQSLVVTLTLNHTWVGDLIATLEHNGTTIDLFRRVRKSDAGSGVGSSNNLGGAYTFDDNAGSRLADAATGNSNFVLAAGSYRATTNLFNLNALPTFSGEETVSLNTTFGNMPVSGDWKLIISDNAPEDRGRLFSWSLEVTSAGGVIPEPASLCGVAALLGCGVLFRNRRPAARC